jgi:hypothetical protein
VVAMAYVCILENANGKQAEPPTSASPFSTSSKVAAPLMLQLLRTHSLALQQLSVCDDILTDTLCRSCEFPTIK